MRPQYEINGDESSGRIDYSVKLLTEIAKLRKENTELKNRIIKVEQRQMINGTFSNSSSNFNLVANQISKANSHHEKPLVNKKIDTSLPEELIPKVIAK
ncbi:hypothetical protein GLOIN_2v1778212 [Rhizophagus clarus]|uniref:Uncharacterized protein n=1 Tax=Rhizophagus clarus TaxID=94130 RepID=A0A8H3QM31_9GLOM|nr:hypothetical protein GLOIN_2v1778212 [Rhizophagus clarus]